MTLCSRSLWQWLLFICTAVLQISCDAFIQRPPLRFDASFRAMASDDMDRIYAYRDEQTRAALVQALVQPEQDVLMELNLVGCTKLPTTNNDAVPCLVLSPDANSPSLLLPITQPQLKLLSFAYAEKRLSKSVCLTLNPLLVNRDDGLFDNLPWSTWTVDPQKRNRDASSQTIDPKFHLGKRDAYNRFMGKDWKGRSISLGNMALRLKYMLEDDKDGDEEDSSQVLGRRVLDLQIRELQMELAEWDYQVAVSRNNRPTEVPYLENSRQECQDRLESAQEALAALEQSSESSLTDILDMIAAMTTEDGRNAAPYRGAMGYAPLLDTKDNVETSALPYTSPYDLLKEIIGDQLNAEVIGAVLENTSLLEGTLVLGGAIVLRRKTPKKTMTINGEKLSVNDEEEDYGNQGIKGGETILVECDGDEAVGMSLACKVPIRVEQSIFGRSSLRTIPVLKDEESKNVYDALPLWELQDKEFSLLVEGQARNQSNAEQTSPLRIARTTSSLYDSMFEPSSGSSSSSSTMFPIDNPIQSLAQYDALSNADKARTLMSLSNFDGKLPRPRALRQSSEGSANPLDQLLLPLVDESVRRQYMIRDAELRQDEAALQKLQSEKSNRQVAKEKAEQAREAGSEDVADWWENEAELYSSLRADVTQDEGSYNRFLDKDEWYERERLARVKRIKKSSFGSLLDGIE